LRRERDGRRVTRAVVDSSVLVSALIAPRDTPPSQVLRALGARALRAGRQPQLIAEVTGVLARPKFDCYVTPEEVAEFLDRLAWRPEPFSQPDALGDALGSRLRVRRCSATAARPIRGTARPLLVTWFTSDSTCGAGRKAADASAARDRVMPARRLLSSPVRAAVAALAQGQSRCEQRWRRLLLVRGERLTPELVASQNCCK
jgi:hypothetical protein